MDAPLFYAYGSERHYIDHLAPLVMAMPGSVLLCGSDDAYDQGQKAVGARAKLGNPRGEIGPAVVVASRKDLMRLDPSRRVGMLEHGAGQTYVDEPDHPSYAGGRGLERLNVVLTPGPHSAERWAKAYPDLEVVELGGSPRLDWYHSIARRLGPRHPARPVVACSWHWDCHVCPETRMTWPYWLPAIRDLDHAVLGHAHPRAWNPALRMAYGTIITTTDWLDVMDQASVYVCDNSSTMYEFAALDRPVICLDHPKYRRGVSHGLRFWDAPPGIRIKDPENLALIVEHALRYPHEFEGAREHAMERVYGGWPDGGSTQRAVRAIVDHLL